jgi:hypothetical protein
MSLFPLIFPANFVHSRGIDRRPDSCDIGIYIYIYVYIYIYIYVYICMYMYIWYHVFVHASMHACVYMYLCMYVCMYVCMYGCMYVCMYSPPTSCIRGGFTAVLTPAIFSYVQCYVFACIHINTYLHTYILMIIGINNSHIYAYKHIHSTQTHTFHIPHISIHHWLCAYFLHTYTYTHIQIHIFNTQTHTHTLPHPSYQHTPLALCLFPTCIHI